MERSGESPKPMTFVCPICDKVSVGLKGLKIHVTRAHPKFADAVMPDGTLAAASDVDEAPYLTSKLTPDSTTPNKNAKSITNLDKLLSNVDKMWNKDKNGPRQVENLEEEMSAKKKGNLVEKAEDNNLVN